MSFRMLSIAAAISVEPPGPIASVELMASSTPAWSVLLHRDNRRCGLPSNEINPILEIKALLKRQIEISTKSTSCIIRLTMDINVAILYGKTVIDNGKKLSALIHVLSFAWSDIVSECLNNVANKSKFWIKRFIRYTTRFIHYKFHTEILSDAVFKMKENQQL